MKTVCHFALVLLALTVSARGAESAACSSCTSSSHCSPELSSAEQCRCDANCAAYGDCCSDRPQCGDADAPLDGLEFECRPTENIFLPRYDPQALGVSYWMVSACPGGWLADNDARRREVERNCTSNAPLLPPVSDRSTGVVYKNEYCAVCNNVVSVAQWQYGLGCTEWLSLELELARVGYIIFELDLEVIQRECLVCSYEPPPLELPSQPRTCYPHVSSCSAQDSNVTTESYEQLVQECVYGPFNPVWAEIGSTIYRNEHCAACNGESVTTCVLVLIPVFGASLCELEADRRLGSQVRPPSVPANISDDETLAIIGAPFSVVLDVGNSGVRVTSSVISTITVVVTCAEGELYDPALETCRPTVCPEVFESSAGGCSFPISGANVSCSTGFIELTDNDDFNDSTVIYLDEVYDVIYYEGVPVICANLSSNGTILRNVTDIFYSYPVAYFILTYVGCTLSLVGVTIILLSLVLFKELRTLSTMVLGNLAASILVTNIFILAGGPIAEATQSRPLCVSVGVFLHFFFLAEFSWMTILSVEITRTLFRGINLRRPPSRSDNRKTFVLYFLLGWTAPIVIVGIAIIINYVPSTSHLVLYGRLEDGTDGLCWINHKVSAILAFVVPVALSLLVNLILLVLITIVLFRAVRNQISLNASSPYIYVRVFAAVFFSSGATWVFGFLALVASRDWAWYPFIILNSVQGFLLFVAFLLTKKVGALYLYMLSFGRLDYRVGGTRTSSKTGKMTSNGLSSSDPTPKLLKHRTRGSDIGIQELKSIDIGKEVDGQLSHEI